MATPNSNSNFHQLEQYTPRDQAQPPSTLRFSPADDPQLYRQATAGSQSDVTKFGFPALSIGDEQGANRAQYSGGDSNRAQYSGDSNPNLISSVPNDVIGQLASLGALWSGLDNSASPNGIPNSSAANPFVDSSKDGA
jgi:hypothetical protein